MIDAFVRSGLVFASRVYDLTYSAPRPAIRGRWVVLHRDRDSGVRFTSLSRARRYARRVRGSVLHYSKSDWERPKPQKLWWSWVAPDLFVIDDPQPPAISEGA